MPLTMAIVCLGSGILFMTFAMVRILKDRSLEAFKRGFDAGLKSKPGVLERRLGELIEENEDLKLKLIAAKAMAQGELLQWAAFLNRQKLRDHQAPGLLCPECSEELVSHKPVCSIGHLMGGKKS